MKRPFAIFVFLSFVLQAAIAQEPIEDYENSFNTTQLYTHYRLALPNPETQVRLSGNYRVLVYDDDDRDNPLLKAEFCVVEPTMSISASVSGNTDIDFNQQHQQVTYGVSYGTNRVIDPLRELHTVVMQNQLWDEAVVNATPDRRNFIGRELEWEHCRDLIFPASNEWRKFETLDVSHTTMGLALMRWDGTAYNAYPFADEERRNYLTDVDADGAFIIRNSDNWEIETTCDYVRVNYELRTPPFPGYYDVVVSGRWAMIHRASERLFFQPGPAGLHYVLRRGRPLLPCRHLAEAGLL